MEPREPETCIDLTLTTWVRSESPGQWPPPLIGWLASKSPLNAFLLFLFYRRTLGHLGICFEGHRENYFFFSELYALTHFKFHIEAPISKPLQDICQQLATTHVMMPDIAAFPLVILYCHLWMCQSRLQGTILLRSKEGQVWEIPLDLIYLLFCGIWCDKFFKTF